MTQTPNKIVLSCPEGPCAGGGPSSVTDVVVVVRAKGASTTTPVSFDLDVTLTSVNGHKTQPASRTSGPHGELRVTFAAVNQGWYRALAVKNAAGIPIESAARDVQVVKIKGTPETEPQVVLLLLSKQGVAIFQFVDDLKSAPLANVKARIRHPDGLEQEHLSDAGGEIRIPGGTGDVFTVVSLSHPTHSTVAGTELEGAG